MKIAMNKSYLIRVVMLLFSNIVAALGVSLCALSGKGVDPFTVLIQGFCNVTGFEIGIVVLSMNIVMLITCFALEPASVKLGTIISMFTFSTCLNVFINNIGTILTRNTGLYPWGYLAFGILCMGIGFSTCILLGIGPNCLDVVLDVFMLKTKFSMKKCKMIVDFISVVLGMLLGAKIGIGTVLCVVIVGVIYTHNIRLLPKAYAYVKAISSMEYREMTEKNYR